MGSKRTVGSLATAAILGPQAIIDGRAQRRAASSPDIRKGSLSPSSKLYLLVDNIENLSLI